jgi:oxygen-dependent protoporphyrinogen oxidase
VAVIGGGVAGLAVARELARRPETDVRLYEASSRLGGVLFTSRSNGFVCEHAANGFLGSAESGALSLCRELGVEVEEASPAARRRWIYRGGRLHALPSNLREFLTTDLLSWSGRLRIMCEPFIPIGGATSGDETVAAFFRRRLGPEAVEALVAPFVTGIVAGDPAELSLASTFPRLAALEARGGLLRGQLAAMLERGRRGSGRAGGKPRLFAPTAGMVALVDKLAAELGERVEVAAPVETVRSAGANVLVRVLSREERFDAAVLALPGRQAAAVTAADAPELSTLLSQIQYVPVVAVHLGYRRDDISHPLDGFGFLVAAGETPRILGALFESAIFSGRAPVDAALFRCMLGGSRDPSAVDLDDESIVALARRDLEPLVGARGEPIHVTVTRWPQAIAQYTPGHRERFFRCSELAAERGLVLAGAAFRGVAINDCVAGAVAVVEKVGRLLAQRATRSNAA